VSARSKLRGVRALLGVLAAVGIAAAPSRCRAQEASADDAPPRGPATIAIVCDAADPFGVHVLAELEALGFHGVILAPDAATASRVSLENAARSAGAIAAIRAVPSERGVEVWIADRVTGKTVLRELASDGRQDRDASLALRVVELLRASLLEITLPKPPPGEVPAPPEVRETLALAPAPIAPPPAPTLRFSIAPAALLSPGGVGAGGSLDLGLAWMPSEHVGLSAFAAIPFSDAHVAPPGGSVDLKVVLAGGGVRFLFTTRASRWAPTADVGLMGVSIHSDGATTSGTRARTDAKAAAAPFARLGLAFAVTPNFRVRADALTGVIAQGVSIHFAGTEVATWGRPFFLLGAGADFGWF
jgi:hypothetical protein